MNEHENEHIPDATPTSEEIERDVAENDKREGKDWSYPQPFITPAPTTEPETEE